MPSVYFAKIVDQDLTRIGQTGLVSSRLNTLQTWCPFKIDLLVSIEGGLLVEGWFHHRHRAGHVRGDWFRHTAELDHDIATICAGGSILGMPKESDYRRIYGASNLRRIMKRAGITWSDLEVHTGTSKVALRQWLDGHGVPHRQIFAVIDLAASRGVTIGPRDFYLTKRRPEVPRSPEQIARWRKANATREANRAAKLAALRAAA